MAAIKYNYHLYWRWFGTTRVFSIPLLMTNYSMSATSYFAAFWQLLTLSVPCREHHSLTPVGCEVHAEIICWKSQISNSDTNTSLSLNCDKIPHDHPITKIWAGLVTWGSKISDLHAICDDFFFPGLILGTSSLHSAQPEPIPWTEHLYPKHQGSSVPRTFQSTIK